MASRFYRDHWSSNTTGLPSECDHTLASELSSCALSSLYSLDRMPIMGAAVPGGGGVVLNAVVALLAADVLLEELLDGEEVIPDWNE